MEEEAINKAIGTRILIFRKTRQITRTKLAKILNITQQQLDKYEKGINRISAAKLAIISKIFKIDITYFYSDLLLDIDTKNNEEIKENINLLLSYYLNIKKSEGKYLIVALTKELAENQ